MNGIQKTLTALLFMLLFQSLTLFAQDSTLVSFELKDQFDRLYTEKDFNGHIVIVIGSDKGGSQYNHSWGQAIHDSLVHEDSFEHLKFLPVADLRGVPFFLKGIVKGKFSKDEENWVLMDWKGIFARSYQFEADASNIIIFESDGKLIHKTAVHELKQETLREILTVVKQLMQEDS